MTRMGAGGEVECLRSSSLDFIRDICDRLTVLDQGRVLESGTVAEIQASKSVQEIYLRRA